MSESRTTTASVEGTPDLEMAVRQFLTPQPIPATSRDQELLREGTNLCFSNGLVATKWGSGSPVLLAHGWDSRRAHWGAFVPGLINAGFCAVAIDAPAHGDTPGVTVDVHEYGTRIAEVGLELGRLAGIVGHSFGAGAVGVALQQGLDARKVVLISGPASLIAVANRWARGHGLNDSQIPRFIRLVEQQVGVELQQIDQIKIAAQSERPALIVHDRGDKIIPVADAIAVAAAWRNSRLFLTDRFGHGRIMIAKEVVGEVVGFLKDS